MALAVVMITADSIKGISKYPHAVAYLKEKRSILKEVHEPLWPLVYMHLDLHIIS